MADRTRCCSQYAGPLAGLVGTGDTAMHCNLAKNGGRAEHARPSATLIEVAACPRVLARALLRRLTNIRAASTNLADDEGDARHPLR